MILTPLLFLIRMLPRNPDPRAHVLDITDHNQLHVQFSSQLFSLSTISIFVITMKSFLNYKVFFLIMFYWSCYHSCPNLSPSAPSTQQPHFLRQPPHHCSCPWVMGMSSLLHFLYCTLHPRGYSVTVYLYFLIVSPLHPFPHTHLPSGNHQNILRIHDPVCVLVCLVCFLDQLNDRYVFFCHFIVHSFHLLFLK